MGFFNRNDAVGEVAESGRMRPDDLLGPKPDRGDGDKGKDAETPNDGASTPEGTAGEATEDASKAKQKLGWTPTTTFDQLVEEMVVADCREYGIELS